MKFAIELSCLTPSHITGIGVYAENLSAHLAKALHGQSQDSLEAWIPFRKSSMLSNVQKRTQLSINTTSEITRWFRPVDLVHGPDFKIPRWGHFKKVVTIHDLVEFDPEFSQGEFMKKARQNFSRMLLQHKPDHIIGISDFTCQKIHEHFPELKIPVTRIYHGVDHRPLKNLALSRVMRQPYVLFVGTLEKRKNPLALIEAFEIFKARNACPWDLVLAGSMGPDGEKVHERIRQSPNAENIFHMHSLEKTQLEALYQYAEAFVLPTLYEGFGFPVLEAMQMGTPVVTSNFGAVQEISGPAALLVNPRDPSSIADAIERIFLQPDFKTELSAKGLRQAAGFTWDKAAFSTLDVYRKTILRTASI